MSDDTDMPSQPTPDDAPPPASAHHYVVIRDGHGHEVGARITDDVTIHEHDLPRAGWAVRVAKEA